MKKVIFAMFALAAFTGNVIAADVIEMKRGVKFDHKAHQDTLKDCTKCHSKAEGGKIEGFGKEFGHNTCKPCHASSKGPTACKDCHKQ